MCASVRHYAPNFHLSTFIFSLDRYHRIHPFVMMFTAYGTETTEYLAEGLGTDALHQAGIAVGKVLIDVGGAEQGGGFALTGQAVVAEEEFLYGAVATVVAVAALDVLHLFGREPVALALGEQCHALGIELGVVDGSVHIDHLADVYAEETAAARRVGEQGGGVAGADERGDARKRYGVVAVGLAHT